jgi:hypothetical protein
MHTLLLITFSGWGMFGVFVGSLAVLVGLICMNFKSRINRLQNAYTAKCTAEGLALTDLTNTLQACFNAGVLGTDHAAAIAEIIQQGKVGMMGTGQVVLSGGETYPVNVLAWQRFSTTVIAENDSLREAGIAMVSAAEAYNNFVNDPWVRMFFQYDLIVVKPILSTVAANSVESRRFDMPNYSTSTPGHK